MSGQSNSSSGSKAEPRPKGARDESTDLSQDQATAADLRSILEDTQDLVIRYSRDVKVQFFNAAADRVYREFLGVTLRVGVCTYDVFPPEHRPYWDRINARVLAGESFTSEFELNLPNGRTAVFETAYHPTWKDGEVCGFNTFSRDVTNQRLQERRLRDHQKMESLGLLAGGVAHDFNNLFSAMLGNLNLAQIDLPPGTPSLRYLANIETAIVRASHLTRQLLAYARKAYLRPEPHNLSLVVRDLAQLLEASISKKIRIELELREDLPAIQADGGHLQQVLMNLVTNAADAIGDHPGTIHLATDVIDLDDSMLQSLVGGRGLPPGPYVSLEVRDDGAGMPPEVVSQIFDPFFTTKGSGRGLGLSAMLGILGTHRGALRVQSEVGRGTVFRVYFPAAAGVEVPQRGPHASVDVAATGTALLADDDPAVLDCTAAALRGLGFQVVVARDGVEAVDRFREHRNELALVVLDVAMPRLSGPEALAQMREMHPTIPILMCSGYTDHATGLEFEARSRSWFLQKPYTLDELQTVVGEILACSK